MNQFDATMIAEGVQEVSSEAEFLEAWQTLVDTGLAWKLQGWFGRTAAALIEAGHIEPGDTYPQRANEELRDHLETLAF